MAFQAHIVVGQTNYQKPESKLRQRNEALARASNIGPVVKSCERLNKLIAAGRITTVGDYCAMGTEMEHQVNKDREPYLLVEDEYNRGQFIPMPIYDCRVDAFEPNSNKCWIDVHAGELLVDVNTAVYWK